MTEQEWTIAHAEEAASQGWNLFESDARGLEIERDDEAGIFDTDEDAVEYVTRQAARGNACAMEAITLVAGTKPRLSATEALLQIQSTLDGWEQTAEAPGLLTRVAEILHAAGYDHRFGCVRTRTRQGGRRR